MAQTPFPSRGAQNHAFGMDRAKAKAIADRAKSAGVPVYSGEPKSSVAAPTPGHPKGGGKPMGGPVGNNSPDPDDAMKSAILRRLQQK